MTNGKWKMTNGKWDRMARVGAISILLMAATVGFAQTPTPSPQAPDLQGLIARQAALVTELDVNGLKVLIKRRAGSQTVATGLFLKGGSRNITATNAGVESLMLSVMA